MNPDRLCVTERWPWKGSGAITLQSIDSWGILAEADSREEMELKLASMGLETEWQQTYLANQFPVREICPVRELRR